jgi:membrane protein implicated in regulation of membrane protease activity
VVVVFFVIALLVVVAIALVAVGGVTARLARTAQPAVFDLEEAVGYIADALPEENAGRLTHDDVRWILRTDVDLLEEASDDEVADAPIEVVDEDHAVARILHRAERDDRELLDADVVAVLDARTGYLEAIGAIGPQAIGPLDPTAETVGDESDEPATPPEPPR